MGKKDKRISFSDRVRLGEKTVIYELMPPPKNLSKSDIDRSISIFSSVVQDLPIHGINIPEVREESRNGQRSETAVVKLEPKILAAQLKKEGISNLIINRPIVYLPWKKQEKWLSEVYFKGGISNIILVGGESSKTAYPGPSVDEAARKIKDKFEDCFLGGITIPKRIKEAKRVLQKSEAGIEFFTSQIIYESSEMKNFLKEYWITCNRAEVLPKMIFLTFAPIVSAKDIELLLWLGVDIPKNTIRFLTTGWFGMGWRSHGLCLNLLEDILEYCARNKIRVPLGINVEHINRHNFESSFVLLERLSHLYLGKSDARERFRYL